MPVRLLLLSAEHLKSRTSISSPWTGRPTKFKARELRYVHQLIRRFPTLSYTELICNLPFSILKTTLKRKIKTMGLRKWKSKRRCHLRSLDAHLNQLFKEGSYLRALHKAEWDIDRIRDEDIPFPTALALLRSAGAKRALDPVTGKATLVDSDLINRAKSGGAGDEELIEEPSTFLSLMEEKKPGDDMFHLLKFITPEKLKSATLPSGASENRINLSLLMHALQEDLMGDISSKSRPMSGLNYIWILSIANLLFLDMEDKLRSCHNQTWHEAYEGKDPIFKKHKRTSFTVMALTGRDSECLEIIRDTFESTRATYDILDCMYWELLDRSEADKIDPGDKSEPMNDPDACLVM